ncbi:MAG: DUF4149 domain-containing protein [Planctomycetota bacterium]
MSDPWRIVFVAVLGAWIGILVACVLALRLLRHRLPPAESWAVARQLIPLTDLLGTWLGGLAILALAVGREGFSIEWAAAILLLALMITASLYDRAVLMPSLEAARRRIDHGEEVERWQGEWRFLLRMATWGRAATLAAGLVALLLGVSA